MFLLHISFKNLIINIYTNIIKFIKFMKKSQSSLILSKNNYFDENIFIVIERIYNYLSSIFFLLTLFYNFIEKKIK